MLFQPSAADSMGAGNDVVTITVAPDSGAYSTLIVYRNQTPNYYENVLGIDIDKLRDQRQLFTGNTPIHSTFPESSDIEGTLDDTIIDK